MRISFLKSKNKHMKKYLLITTLFFTTSCVETVVIGAAATGVVLTQEKTVKETKDDLIIEAKIDKEFIGAGLKNPTNKIGVTVDEGRVLLTGNVSDEKIIAKAGEIVWKVKGVKEVIDEIQFNQKKTAFGIVGNYFTDAAITTQINSKLLFDKKITSANFEVITINRIVYLFGVAKSQREMNAANDIAAKIVGVKKVISHVRIVS
jgi:osmotically-inducible protein OsmY